MTNHSYNSIKLKLQVSCILINFPVFPMINAWNNWDFFILTLVIQTFIKILPLPYLYIYIVFRHFPKAPLAYNNVAKKITIGPECSSLILNYYSMLVHVTSFFKMCLLCFLVLTLVVKGLFHKIWFHSLLTYQYVPSN